jgi:hypothetical protein
MNAMWKVMLLVAKDGTVMGWAGYAKSEKLEPVPSVHDAQRGNAAFYHMGQETVQKEIPEAWKVIALDAPELPR